MATVSDGGGSARVRSGKREPGRRESEREGKRTGGLRGVFQASRRGGERQAGREGGGVAGRVAAAGCGAGTHLLGRVGRRRQRSWRAGAPPGWAGLLLLGCAGESPR